MTFDSHAAFAGGKKNKQTTDKKTGRSRRFRGGPSLSVGRRIISHGDGKRNTGQERAEAGGSSLSVGAKRANKMFRECAGVAVLLRAESLKSLKQQTVQTSRGMLCRDT